MLGAYVVLEGPPASGGPCSGSKRGIATTHAQDGRAGWRALDTRVPEHRDKAAACTRQESRRVLRVLRVAYGRVGHAISTD